MPNHYNYRFGGWGVRRTEVTPPKSEHHPGQSDAEQKRSVLHHMRRTEKNYPHWLHPFLSDESGSKREER